jgi:hypothetical protein
MTVEYMHSISTSENYAPILGNNPSKQFVGLWESGWGLCDSKSAVSWFYYDMLSKMQIIVWEFAEQSQSSQRWMTMDRDTSFKKIVCVSKTHYFHVEKMWEFAPKQNIVGQHSYSISKWSITKITTIRLSTVFQQLSSQSMHIIQ